MSTAPGMDFRLTTNPMPDTPHIKRFEEYPRSAPFGRVQDPVKAMLNDLAEHIERLERKNEDTERRFREIQRGHYLPTNPSPKDND